MTEKNPDTERILLAREHASEQGVEVDPGSKPKAAKVMAKADARIDLRSESRAEKSSEAERLREEEFASATVTPAGSTAAAAAGTGSTPSAATDDAATAASAPAGTAYVHHGVHHVTQPPVDDLAADELESSTYLRDSSFTTGGAGPLAGRAYRRSRAEMPQIKQERHYGKYLEVPKGRRSLFSSRDARRHRRVIAGVVVVVAAVAVVLWILFH